MWAEKDSYVLKQATVSESVKSSSLYFEFVLTKLFCFSWPMLRIVPMPCDGAAKVICTADATAVR